jgi:hypothetical protein
MKAIIDGKYIMELGDLDKIQLVESVGPWGKETYTIVGEVTDAKIVSDNAITDAEVFDELKSSDYKQKADNLERQLNELKLQMERNAVYDKITADNPQVKGKKLRDYLDTIKYSYALTGITIHDYNKWKETQNGSN